jgi:hypothetical protein
VFFVVPTNNDGSKAIEYKIEWDSTGDDAVIVENYRVTVEDPEVETVVDVTVPIWAMIMLALLLLVIVSGLHGILRVIGG